ncbi:hypothetical protein VB797_23855 [Rivularia sp. UHCC 0363]|nr:hypothetical protein [Rivularia sp. UHCC 0363]MEA5597382.1 hypothetical protein [Rivularia sp. UHCC 0363]
MASSSKTTLIRDGIFRIRGRSARAIANLLGSAGAAGARNGRTGISPPCDLGAEV